MIDIPAPNKFEKWKRPLIGGLLSAGLAGISLFLNWLVNYDDAFMFLGWPIFLFIYLWLWTSLSDGVLGLISVIALFGVGFGVTYFIKDNKKAIGCWFLLLVLFAFISAISFGVFFVIHGG